LKLYKDTDQQNLTLKLGDKKSNLFCRAVVYNNVQQPILIEPLYHASNGLYTTLINPKLAVGSYHVVYEVFKDAAYTKPYKFYQDSEEFLRVEDIQNTIITKVDEAIDQVDDLDAQVT